MKIAYLKMKNFMLYKKLYKKFDDKEVIGIICEYKSNKRKSNRGGKTTIPEAIKYCLYGITRAKKEIKLIHHGEKFMEVEVGLVDDDGNTYTIRRGRDHKNNGLIECNWVDKKKAAQKDIDALLGSDGTEFELINYFKQADIQKFMLLPAGEKTKHMIKWLDNNHWSKLNKHIGDKLKELVKKLNKKKTKREAIVEELDDVDKLKKRVKKTKSAIGEIEEALDKVVIEKEKLQKKYRSTDEQGKLEEQREQIKEDIDEVKLTIEDSNTLKSNLKILVKNKDKLSIYLKGKKFNSVTYNLLKKEYSEIGNKIYRVEELLDIAERDGCHSGICPVLNESCDRIEKDKNQIKKLKKKIKNLDAKGQVVSTKIGEFEKIEGAMDALKLAKESIKEGKARIKPIKPLNKKLGSLRVRLKGVKQELKQAKGNNLGKKIDKYNKQIKITKKGLDDLHEKLGQYKSRIKQHKKASTKISKLDKSIKKLEIDVEDQKYLAFMSGKNGIPSQEIENAFSEIESDINLILSKMGTTFDVSFNADKELGTLESECGGCGSAYPKFKRKECSKCGEPRRKKRKDELHLTIREHGNVYDYEMDSGGGHTFISLAVRIALTLLKKRQTSAQLDVLFLDEIDSALDEDATEHIMKLITKVLIKLLGFKQIFWVSHNKKIQESLPNTLKVNKLRKEAKVKWV